MVLLLFISFNFLSIQSQEIEPSNVAIKWTLGNEDTIPSKFLNYSDSTYFPLRQPYWIKLHVKIEEEGDYVLKGGNWYMQAMQYYSSSNKLLTTGNSLESYFEKGEYLFFVYFPFKDFQDKSNVSFSLIKTTDFYKDKLQYEMYRSVFMGILFFLFVMSASFFVLSSTNDKVYIYYAWYLFSILFFFSYQYGVLGDFIPIINYINPYFIWVLSASISISYFFFAQVFLNLKRNDRFAFNLLQIGKYLILAIVLIETVSYLLGYDIQHNGLYKFAILALQLPLMILVLYRVYKQKTTLSWIFVTGAIILALATTVGQISSTLKSSSETNFLVQLGLLIEVLIFSIGIGVRMWIIEEDKRKAQSSLLKQMKQNVVIQQEYTFELENKVKERTADLHIKNEEKDVLLKEIHHRVKNNLQTIASLLSIQLRRLKSAPAKVAIEDSMNRVKVMGLIHKFLYQKDSYTSINLKEYVNQLLGMLIDSSNPKTKITQKVEVDSIEMDIDRAISIGLILNELVTNSIKHAFAQLDDPILTLKVNIHNNIVFITFSDNGNLREVDVFSNTQGFGWKLINSLVGSLDGVMEHTTNNGFEVKINFPLNVSDK